MNTITQSGLELPAIDGITGGWVLDRFSHPQLGMTRTAVVLGQAKVGGIAPAAMQLADRMAAIVQRRPVPPDMIVAAVPSATGINEEFAARIAEVLRLPFVEVFGVRSGIFGRLDGSVRGRIKPKVRRVTPHVLLVDDAVRTGDTLRSCAAMLRERGAEGVWAVAAVAFDGATEVPAFF